MTRKIDGNEKKIHRTENQCNGTYLYFSAEKKNRNKVNMNIQRIIQ